MGKKTWDIVDGVDMSHWEKGSINSPVLHLWPGFDLSGPKGNTLTLYPETPRTRRTNRGHVSRRHSLVLYLRVSSLLLSRRPSRRRAVGDRGPTGSDRERTPEHHGAQRSTVLYSCHREWRRIYGHPQTLCIQGTVGKSSSQTCHLCPPHRPW